MPAKINFKKSMLAHCIHHIFNTNDINRLLCTSVFLSVFASPIVYANENTATSPQQVTEPQQLPVDGTPEAKEADTKALVQAAQQLGLPDNKIDQIPEKVEALESETSLDNEVDSLEMLRQQEQNVGIGNEFKPIELNGLSSDTESTVDPDLAALIYKEAEEARLEGEAFRAGVGKQAEPIVTDANLDEVTEISQAPIDIDEVLDKNKEVANIIATDNQNNTSDTQIDNENITPEAGVKPGFFQRILNRINPNREKEIKIPRISADVDGAPTILANNIKAKLSTFTQEALYSAQVSAGPNDPNQGFSQVIPQLRNLARQGAQAVGYYDAEFSFTKLSNARVRVVVKPKEPVKVREQNIDIQGAGANLAQFRILKVLPELDKGDIFHHGKYELTKNKINEAAANNGFFDSYWLLHDAMVLRPENKADINLRFETGKRYAIGDVQFKMSDQSKKLPIREEILRTLVPWEPGADYTAWRVNLLANNLTNSRYFNYTLVDAVKPEPITHPLDLPPDLQALKEEQNLTDAQVNPKAAAVKSVQEAAPEAAKITTDEQQFAGTQSTEMEAREKAIKAEQDLKQTQMDLLQIQARNDQTIPVIVTLNADKLNSLEAGIGYGTDTGVRLRSQYRRAIVNELGHSFDANLELSKIRQSIDSRYNIPYKHPLNDYIGLVAGYEREARDTLGNGLDLVVESAVLGADRIIKGARKDWQHIIGLRYRLDRVSVDGNLDAPIAIEDIPDAFLAPNASTEQQSLLFGYEATKTISDNRLNPTRGFKQNYKIELGSKSVMSDADMAIANANFKFLYSLGEKNDHQFVGGLNLGYIATNEFEKVPYNLRYFAGGDQSLRGFDYKSLSPENSGFRVGGQALAVGSLEYNYQFKEGWRAAVFGDYGNAYDKEFSNPTEYSLGVGIRWTSPIGPIRLDVASGLSDPDRPIRLHFYIGPQL